MTIVRSEVVSATPQVDGRLAVLEVHHDAWGGRHEVAYLADRGRNPELELAAHAAQVAREQNELELYQFEAWCARGRSPLEFALRWNQTITAYTYLLTRIATHSDPLFMLPFVPVLAAFTVDQLSLALSVPRATAEAIHAWCVKLLGVTRLIAESQAIRGEIATQLLLIMR